ncbi:MAG: ATPase [Phycisphaerae bacterium]
MTQTTRIDLPILLPEVPDAQDACVNRLRLLLGGERGVGNVHVVEDGGTPTLCLHFDPALVSLAQVERLAKAAGARLTERFGHAVLSIHAIEGEDAARRIEAGLRGIDGVLGASVNLAAQRVGVEFEKARIDVEAIEENLRDMGYAARARPTVGEFEEAIREKAERWYARNRELAWSLVAGTLMVLAWSADRWTPLPHVPVILLYLASYTFGAFDLVRHAAGTLRRGRFVPDIDLLMLLAAIGAAVLGAWAEGAFLLFLFSLAHALEHYALGRARGAIRSLQELAPPVARVLRDGREVELKIEEVRAGEVVLVRPAERIPVDGKVASGRSAVNQAPITGESAPVEKSPGEEVFAGTINGEGSLEIETTRAVGDRTLDRVIRLVEEAQTQKAPTQQFTERFERIFVPAVLVLDVFLIVVPPLVGFWGWSTSFYRGMTLLVAASPCALALGTPSAVLAGIAQAARNGVLIKGGMHLESLGTLRALAFDKTGTLTAGRPEVTDIIPANGVTQDDLLGVTASVERKSQHPLAQAVARRAEAAKLDPPEAGDLESVTARGVRSRVDGDMVEIGSLKMWEESPVSIPPEIRTAVAELQSRGRSIMVTRHGQRWLGVLGLADPPRPGVQSVLNQLRELGLNPLVMLTGDNQGVGEAVGREVGVDEVHAELLPEDKVAVLKELLRTHGSVGMVGDGVNDAPALANATVGIAMGGAGTAAALETADVALMADDLARLPFAVALSRRAKAIIQQNLYASLGIVGLLLLAAVTGLTGIGPAVFVHEGSTLLVILNSLRLLGYSPKP